VWAIISKTGWSDVGKSFGVMFLPQIPMGIGAVIILLIATKILC